MKGKVTVLTALMLISAAFVIQAEPVDPNVLPPAWVCEFLDELANQGIISKSSAGLFETETGFSREKAAVLTAKAAAKIEQFKISGQNTVRSTTIPLSLNQQDSSIMAATSNEEFSWRESSLVIAHECLRLENAIETNRVDGFSVDFAAVVLAKAVLEMNKQQPSSGDEFSWQESSAVLAAALVQSDKTLKNGGMLVFDASTAALAKSLIHMSTANEPRSFVNAIHKESVAPRAVSYGNYEQESLAEQDTVMFTKLEQELKPELESLGFFKTQKLMQASQQGTVPQITDKVNRLKVDGEVRYNYVTNRGAKKFSYNDSQLRTRLYFDYNIDNNWHAYTMLESDRSIMGKSNNNGNPSLERVYVDGNIGVSKLTAGSFGLMLGEGNIFDTQFDGVRVQVPGPVDYTLLYGTSSDYLKKSTILTARYDSYDYNVTGGIHHLNLADGRLNTIFEAGGTYNFENFSLGAMYLHSTMTSGNGYVLTLSKGLLKSWEPGSSSVWLKYYNQPQGTYVVHTMNGLANSMNGFKGYGLGYSTTLRENLVANFDYYNLIDKLNSNSGNTFWFDLTYYFSNNK